MTRLQPSDQAARDRVLVSDRSFIVQAPAGSGKTELLVRRYLRLLEVVSAPEEIVAITFTLKAAAEMRSRIIKALESVKSASSDSGGVPDVNAQEHQRLALRVLKRDEELGWRLISNPARMRVQTIDSFCAGLARQMPVLSKLGGQPETIDDARELYRQAAANTLKFLDDDVSLNEKGSTGDPGYAGAVEILLQHLDNDLPRARDMLAVMLQKRDQWLRHIAGASPDRHELEDTIRHSIETILIDAFQAFPEDIRPKFVECLAFATENLPGLGFEIAEFPEPSVDNLEQWKFIANQCTTQAGEWRKALNKNLGFPAGGGINKAMKEHFTGLLEVLCDHDSLKQSFQEIRPIPKPGYSDAEWQVIESLCILLKLANAELSLLFAARNQVDFTGISMAAIRALGDEDDPTDLALYLDYRISHILVDEFQDISTGQYNLLKMLTAGWSMEDGHSLFLVGDPMQSIYRFRDAEVGLFLQTWNEQRLGQVPIEAVNIEVNFRSDPALVNWVNTAFPEVFPNVSENSRGAVKFTPATAIKTHEEGSRMCLHPLPDRDDDQEAEIVLEQIRTIRKTSTNENIAILVRSRTHLHAITALLIRTGMSFRAVEIEQLSKRPVIQDLLALTRALHHEADRVAWLALLRAPWCGLTLDDLLVLMGDTKNDTVWHCLQDDCRLDRLSAVGRHQLDRLCKVLREALARQGRMPLRRWVESVWINLGGPATLQSSTDLLNADTFFELLEEMDEGGDLKGQKECLDKVNTLYAGADVQADNSLQVMTIHKSKGLEFDHVILPGLSRRSRSDESQLLLWAETPELLLAPVKAPYEEVSPIYDFIRRLEKQKQQHETSRLLYVAATRARRQLHLVAVRVNTNGKVGPAGNTFSAKLWPAIKGQFEEEFKKQVFRDTQPLSSEEQLTPALRRLSAQWTLPQPPPPIRRADSSYLEPLDTEDDYKDIKYEWAGQTIKYVGTVMHRCIQQMAIQGIDYWNAEKISNWEQYYRESLKSLGVYDEELDAACALVQQALEGILEDPRGRWLLEKHPEQACEYSLTGIHSGKVVNIIIDRTFIDDDGNRWIVDYKASLHRSGDIDSFLNIQQQRYEEQLEKYAEIMSAIDSRPIKLGLYFPLLKGWREWEFQRAD